MRGHVQTYGRGRLRAWSWVVLVALATSTSAARAQQPPGVAPTSPTAEPVDLAADLIRDWWAGPEHWAILDGHAAISMGADVVRAERAAVRIVRVGPPDRPVYRLDIYAEGQVLSSDRPGPVPDRLHRTFESIRAPQLAGYTEGGVVHGAATPSDEALCLRGFSPSPSPAAEPERVVASGAVSTQFDAEVRRTQFDEGFPELPLMPSPEPDEALPGLMPSDDPSPAPGQEREPGAPIDLEPLPEGSLDPLEPGAEPVKPPVVVGVPAPILGGTQRRVSIFPRDGGPTLQIETLPSANGVTTLVIRGGVNVVTDDSERGTVDLQADNVVIWQGVSPSGIGPSVGPNQELIQDGNQPLEVYLEGNVTLRQDERQVAGNGDQRTFLGSRAYYDFRTERLVILDAEVDIFNPGLITPFKIKGPLIQQYTPQILGPNGRTILGNAQIRADQTVSTGSRFPHPGYRFTNRAIDMIKVPVPLTEPTSGTEVGRTGDPNGPQDQTWQLDARQNIFFLGPLPVFYWPRLVTTPDDIDPPIRNFTPRYNNYFGYQILSDWNGFKLFGLNKPKYLTADNWNVDIDYLSERGFALGSEFGYFGPDFFSDIANDFSAGNSSKGYRRKDLFPNIAGGYFGYFDFWGLKDKGLDVLGSGPAVITNGPPGAGRRGFQRESLPPFQDFRGRVLARHMQSLLSPQADPWEDFRLQVEGAYISDRHFLEQYYKRLFDTGLDQSTLAYAIRQRDNWAATFLTEANLQDFYTDTQWLPKFEYTRLGDNLFDGWLSYYQSSGIDYANTHTAVEVNNPNIFAFIPFDPVSNTSGPLRTGRAYTNQELDLPIDLDLIRVVPYVQGQAVGWNNQLNGEALGRIWGAAGARANIMAWKVYPDVESELFNVHGLNHKINFDADYRNAYSNVRLEEVGVQDDLDDNTYEFVRRYFALTNYAGGLLPPQFDPRHLILRRAVSPIAGSTDIQASIQTLQLGIRQRLQTKRGPEGRRRIIDYMTLDASTTYFPYASRDNFGTSFGQTTYNWEWYVGDRTSIYSTGWFEFFDITGQALLKTNPDSHNDPFGIKVINSGISINRPPRGNVNIGYTIINSATINTSALNLMFSYWLSPKWYGGFGTSYDFGNAILLGSSFSLTRIGADYLTSVGLAVDPQRNAYTVGIEISPRLSPNLRLGSTSVLTRFDSRFAPTQ